MNNRWTTGIGCALLAFPIVAWSWLMPLAEAMYDGTAPSLLQHLFESIYPRFTAEKNRLPFEFFMDKAIQVFWRAWAVSLLVFLVIQLDRNPRFRSFWDMETSTKWIDTLRWLYFGALAFYTWDWLPTLLEFGEAKSFYKPIHLYAMLHLPYPTEFAFYILFGAFWASLTLAFFNIKAPYSSAWSIILFLLLQGYLYCFEKVSHAYAPFGNAGMLMPFLLAEREKSVRMGALWCNAWALRLIQLMIAASYSLSGLEKLTISGGRWLLPDTLSTHLLQAQNTSAEWLLLHPMLLAIAPTLILIFQLGFISVLWLPRTRWFFMAGSILFHWGTWWVLGVGSPITPWIFCLVFFWKMKND